MEKTSFKPYIVIIVLLALTSVALAFSVDVRISDEAGIRMELPDRIGEWVGQELRYCQSPSCRREFLLNELDGAPDCPLCGTEVESMSLAEKQLLPADTIVLKKRYRHPTEGGIHVSIVLSGKERSSIHRPQVCLVGQGRTILDSQILPVPIEGRDPLDVMVLDLATRARTGAGSAPEHLSYYAYWFVGKDRETPYHTQRMLWMALDRIFRSVSHQWAYVSIGGGRNPGSNAHSEQIRDFVRAFYPELRLN